MDIDDVIKTRINRSYRQIDQYVIESNFIQTKYRVGWYIQYKTLRSAREEKVTNLPSWITMT